MKSTLTIILLFVLQLIVFSYETILPQKMIFSKGKYYYYVNPPDFPFTSTPTILGPTYLYEIDIKKKTYNRIKILKGISYRKHQIAGKVQEYNVKYKILSTKTQIINFPKAWDIVENQVLFLNPSCSGNLVSGFSFNVYNGDIDFLKKPDDSIFKDRYTVWLPSRKVTLLNYFYIPILINMTNAPNTRSAEIGLPWYDLTQIKGNERIIYRKLVLKKDVKWGIYDWTNINNIPVDIKGIDDNFIPLVFVPTGEFEPEDGEKDALVKCGIDKEDDSSVGMIWGYMKHSNRLSAYSIYKNTDIYQAHSKKCEEYPSFLLYDYDNGTVKIFFRAPIAPDTDNTQKIINFIMSSVD